MSKDPSAKEEESSGDSPETGRQLFTARASTLFRCGLVAAVVLVTGSGFMASTYYRSTYWNRIGIAPTQPVPFSHRHHAGELRIDCRNCHATVETSAFAGMPSTQTCLNCHSQIFTNTPLLRPVIESAAHNLPLQWNRVTRLPDHVYFDHSIHVNKGVSCTTCHGEVRQMALMAKGEPLTMRWCLDCHRDPGPRLHPASEIFAAASPPTRSRGQMEALLRSYHIHPEILTNCSSCHR
jgi:hypothetical protein